MSCSHPGCTVAIEQARCLLDRAGWKPALHMKSPLEAPEKQIAEETSAKPEKPAPAAVIDTSKMVKGQREALELA